MAVSRLPPLLFLLLLLTAAPGPAGAATPAAPAAIPFVVNDELDRLDVDPEDRVCIDAAGK